MSNITGSDSMAAAAGMSRRTVVKGAAWALPVVAAAVAVPAAAASAAEQTQCITADSMGVTIVSSPVSTPFATGVHPTYPGTVHQFEDGIAYEITSTMTIVYTGALPSLVSDLRFDVMGSGSFQWTLKDAPLVTSSAGNMATGAYVEAAVATPEARRARTTVTPVGVGAGVQYVQPNDVITVTWNMIAHGPSGAYSPAGTSAYAYPQALIESCAGWHGSYPLGAPASVDTFYQYVQ